MLRYASLLLLCISSLTSFAVEFQFDYRYDSAQFFDVPERRLALETAGRLMNRYVDDLPAVSPSGDNTWSTFLPRPGGSRILLTDLQIEEDTIVIYVGGDDRLGDRLAAAFETIPIANGTSEFTELVNSRGTSPMDFSPLVGSIGFNDGPDVNWFFGQEADEIGERQFDFVTVAMHELGHVLGVGSSDTFNNYIESGRFSGPQAVAQGSKTNPSLLVDQTGGHFAPNTQSTWNGNSQEALFARTIGAGKRQFPTALDRAVLRDIGWEEAQRGDANLDRIVDESDFQLLDLRGKYETGELASWSDGDFNDDGVFTSMDLIDSLATQNDEVAFPISAEFDDFGQTLSISWEDEIVALQVADVDALVELGIPAEPSGSFDMRLGDEVFVFRPNGIHGSFDVTLVDAPTFPFQVQVAGVTPTGNRFSTSLTLVPEAQGVGLIGILFIVWFRRGIAANGRRQIGGTARRK